VDCQPQGCRCYEHLIEAVEIDAEGKCEAINQERLQQFLLEGVVLDASLGPRRGTLLGCVLVARSEGLVRRAVHWPLLPKPYSIH